MGRPRGAPGRRVPMTQGGATSDARHRQHRHASCAPCILPGSGGRSDRNQIGIGSKAGTARIEGGAHAGRGPVARRSWAHRTRNTPASHAHHPRIARASGAHPSNRRLPYRPMALPPFPKREADAWDLHPAFQATRPIHGVSARAGRVIAVGDHRCRLPKGAIQWQGQDLPDGLPGPAWFVALDPLSERYALSTDTGVHIFLGEQGRRARRVRPAATGRAGRPRRGGDGERRGRGRRRG